MKLINLEIEKLYTEEVDKLEGIRIFCFVIYLFLFFMKYYNS